LTQKVPKTDASAFLRSLEVRRNEHPRLSGLDEFKQSLILVECPFTSARRDTRHFSAFSPSSTGGCQAIRTLIAFRPIVARVPGFKSQSDANLDALRIYTGGHEIGKCKNISGPPASGRMNPKPRSALHHFSFPAGTLPDRLA
jgi:hypothetical protein